MGRGDARWVDLTPYCIEVRTRTGAECRVTCFDMLSKCFSKVCIIHPLKKNLCCCCSITSVTQLSRLIDYENNLDREQRGKRRWWSNVVTVTVADDFKPQHRDVKDERRGGTFLDLVRDLGAEGSEPEERIRRRIDRCEDVCRRNKRKQKARKYKKYYPKRQRVVFAGGLLELSL
ncbi:hypothetical protein F2P81_022797 [Scophthalmus maximus]|uniref:Uncharacterized protein n=1 Tax=Scophthalmus maximus TaxID=52904 RepID=A0A6A4RTB4_SCOMX|nr:hypothetical protein F2P81_022797 [Scophthalmus maximus]